MTAREMWAAFAAKTGTVAEYDAWPFGGDPDKLAGLVKGGVKTATASAYPLYALEGEALPQAGEYSVILDARDQAVCVVRPTKVYVVPFRDVTSEHARKEGEGDRSLDYWRAVHRDFFTGDMARSGLAFSEDMPVVCEEVEVVYSGA